MNQIENPENLKNFVIQIFEQIEKILGEKNFQISNEARSIIFPSEDIKSVDGFSLTEHWIENNRTFLSFVKILEKFLDKKFSANFVSKIYFAILKSDLRIGDNQFFAINPIESKDGKIIGGSTRYHAFKNVAIGFGLASLIIEPELSKSIHVSNLIMQGGFAIVQVDNKMGFLFLDDKEIKFQEFDLDVARDISADELSYASIKMLFSKNVQDLSGFASFKIRTPHNNKENPSLTKEAHEIAQSAS